MGTKIIDLGWFWTAISTNFLGIRPSLDKLTFIEFESISDPDSYDRNVTIFSSTPSLYPDIQKKLSLEEQLFHSVSTPLVVFINLRVSSRNSQCPDVYHNCLIYRQLDMHCTLVRRCFNDMYRPLQGRPKAPPATQNASQKSLGDKNKEVRGDKTYLFV